MKKPVLLLASLALAGSALTACGGGDAESAPKDASKKDFCEGLTSMVKDSADLAKASEDKQLDFIHDFADKMIEIGTPKDMSDTAREQWVKGLDLMKDADKDFIKSDDNPLEATESKEMSEYITKNCASEMQDALKDSMGDAMDKATDEMSDAADDASAALEDLEDSLPSDLPTEIPSDLESALGDIPTEQLKELEEQMASLTANP